MNTSKRNELGKTESERSDHIRQALEELSKRSSGYSMESLRKFLRHPVTVGVLSVGAIFIALHASSFMLDAMTKATTSYRRFKRSMA